MLRVLHVVEELTGTGGTPRKLLYLVKQSNRRLMRHDFICFLPGDLDETFTNMGANVETINSAAPHRIVSAILRRIASSETHILATHFSRAFACGYLATRIGRLPLIHNEHGPSLPSSLEGIARNPLAAWLKRQCLAKADAVVCNSAYTADTVRRAYSVPSAQLHVIHNPVECRIVPSPVTQSMPRADSTVVVGHVGGMIPIRDQATLVRALAMLLDAGLQAELELVGDGPMRASLEQLTDEMGLRDRVFFRGYRTDLADFLSRVQVYVNPAVAEGFGIAVVEAMLAGIPVVLADAGAHRELIDGGAAGLLYEPRNPSDLCHKILDLVRCTDLQQRIARSGREFAQRAFAPHRYAAAYEQLALQVASAHGRRPHLARGEVQD